MKESGAFQSTGILPEVSHCLQSGRLICSWKCKASLVVVFEGGGEEKGKKDWGGRGEQWIVGCVKAS